MKRTPDRQPKSGLTLEHVAETAIGIADREGVHAVSMRRLARDLDVTPMALYWHVADKDALLDAMAEHVVARSEVRDVPDASWEDRLRGVLTALVALLRKHPWMGRLLIERLVPRPNYVAALEILLDALRDAGFPTEDAAVLAQQAVQTVVSLVEHEPRRSKTGIDPEAAVVRKTLRNFDSTRYPRVREAAVAMTSAPPLGKYHRLGLDTVIAGLRGLAAEGDGGRRRSRPRAAQRKA